MIFGIVTYTKEQRIEIYLDEDDTVGIEITNTDDPEHCHAIIFQKDEFLKFIGMVHSTFEKIIVDGA